MTLQNNLDKIEHIVVLMMENRSFDNVLGWLYPDNPDFRGVDSSMSNPDSNGNLHYVTKGTDPTAPFPDPNEPYQFVYRQMFSEPPTMPVPMMTDVTPTMQGFVIDYENALATANAEAEKKHKPPFPTEPGVIMNCFAPESLPVINGLAQAYAVCDNWFCSVPTETFPNRSFIHAATSSGNVYNHWKDWIGIPQVFINDTETIYNRLYDNGIDWRVYHAGPVFACNALICQEKLYDFIFDNFSSFDNFAVDAANGNLPAYTFIEPNFICSSLYGPETDMHPAYGVFDTGAPTDVRYGDQFIYDVYTTLRNSPCWEKTLFIITFDEHGGTFDHFPVEPSPKAVSPDGVVIPYKNGHNGGSNFDFSRFGVRVPAVLISPWIEAGTICHTQFDHTSVIKTVSEKWLGGQSLTARDAAANCVSEVLSLSTPRTDTPDITPDTPPVFQDCANQPLSPLQSALMAAAARLIALKTKKLINLDELDTKEKAVNTLENVWRDFLASKK
ncbi:MAG: alkaline phosphatase family protein [Pyrinomonadaceae bacterium]